MKILVVDDQRSNVQLIEMILEDYGYECCSAQNGQEACEIFSQSDDIQLILMDVNMPVMDGLSATRAIKAQCGDRHVPVIFVTALDNVEMLTCCLEAGGEDFVPKPINEDILISKIRAHQRTLDTYQKLAEANQKLIYHRNIMNHELKIVEHVFNNGFSRFKNKFDNIAYHISPMSMFNGDLLLIEKSRLGSTYIILGDFTGHGLAAAIGCLPVSDVFQAMAIKHRSVSEIAREINSRLQKLLPSNMFFCAAIMELNQTAERLNVWMGGMHELLVFSESGEYIQKIESAHMPLGVLDDDDFDDTEQAYVPPPNCHIFGYTDGVVEANNAAGEMFGAERLLTAIKDSFHSQSGGSSIEYVAKELEVFQASVGRDDDISFLSITCRPQTDDLNVKTSTASTTADVVAEQGLPWSLNLALSAEMLANKQLVHHVVNVITAVDACKNQQQSIFLVVSELINNAIEHGILGLSSTLKDTPEGFQLYYQLRGERLQVLEHGGVNVQCQISEGLPQQLSVTVTDTGTGFDYETVQMADVDEDLTHGRGLAFNNELCESIEYSDGGRSVTAVINL